ncbi:MAG TPA: hypothetical protein VK255_03270 [Patescibacteria group bacterium]|nr:hypothetical protein [Patescibacteria group bacterium]
MSLGDIKRKLYQREQEKNLSEHEKSFYDPRHSLGSQMPDSSGDLWAKKKTGFDEPQKIVIKKGFYALGGVLAVILLILVAYLIRTASFSADRVTVTINGPERADSGKLLTYEINYKNNNRTELKNVQLKVVYPEDFKPEDNPNFTSESPTSGSYNIGAIPGNKAGKVVFNGRIYSPKGALVYLKGQLSYNPGSYSTRYTSEKQLGINVFTSPITLEVAAPQSIASGDEINYQINYKNEGESELSDIRIKIDYPEGFSFTSSDPKSFEGNNIWYVGTIAPGKSGKLIVDGRLEGEKGANKNLKVYIGSTENGNFVSFNDGSADTKMVGSVIAITQTVGDSKEMNASAGDLLRFMIDYKNTSETGLKNLIVTDKIDSPVLDYASLEASGGHFDSESKTITWKASDHPGLKGLEPGQGGKIDFTIKIKESIPVSSANDKNYVISSIVKIDSPDIITPISMNKIVSGNKVDIKLNSKLFLSVKGYYTDKNITNSGPVPPKVGEETSYVIHWIASNINNDVNNARVEATLPTWAKATGEVYPEGANITYNQRNNTVIWEIGNMSAGTGVLSTPKEVSFQIKIKPSPDQVGRLIELIRPSTFSAKDAFTGEEISSTAEAKNTHLEEDPSVSMKEKAE